MEMTTSLKSRRRSMRRNSIALSTTPAGVSPYRLMMRSESDPWFTPMRNAVECSRHMSTSGISRFSMRFISSAYSSSVYSKWRKVRAGSTKLPGLMRTFSTIAAAASAAAGLKWMSATNGAS